MPRHPPMRPGSALRLALHQPSHAMHAAVHIRHGQLNGPARLPAWQRRVVYASFAVLALTGLGWLGVHFLVAQSDDGLAHSAAKLWAIRAHADAALCTLVMVGSLMPHHMRAAWHMRKNRASGALVAGVMLLLALTGYAISYAPEGLVRQWSAWSHWAVGAAVPLLLLAHVLLGHRTRQGR